MRVTDWVQSADWGGGNTGQVPGEVERPGGEDQETHQDQELGLPRPRLRQGEVGQLLKDNRFYLNSRNERRQIFDEDEDLEEYEGYLPLRARKKARCLTTETVRRTEMILNIS